jgi:hypothetical protein
LCGLNRYRKAGMIPRRFLFDPAKAVAAGTGGTIASRLDYGLALIPAFTPGELYGAVPS